MKEKSKMEMKIKSNDKEKEQVFENYLINEQQETRKVIMKMAKKKFKKINIKLAGI